MYLHRLIEFSEKHPELFPPIGYKMKKFQWYVDISLNGTSFIPANRGDERTLPDLTRSSGNTPILLSDKVEYVFGIAASKGANEKTIKRAKDRQQEYLKLLKKCADKTNNKTVEHIYHILSENKEIDLPAKIKADDTVVFRVNHEEFPHENAAIQLFWKDYLQPNSDKHQDAKQCMLCGNIGPVLERHTIEFPLGPERTKLISANASAYESHGLKASIVSPVCPNCEQKYGKALQYLLQRHRDKEQPGGPHMFRIQDLTYVYWLRDQKQLSLNSILSLSTSNPDEVKELLRSVFTGSSKERQLNNFCILTLSANKARMVVRGYEENSLTEIQKNIDNFYKAQDVNNSHYYGVYNLASTMYTKPSTQMEKYALSEWMNWMLKGRPLSLRVLVPLLKQIQARGSMYPQQSAAIKSWLVSQKKGEWSVTVGKNNGTEAYICGRLFAVLEKLQQEATNSNESIASRFFGSASTAPSSVFGLLIKNSQAHLNTIRKKNIGREINYSKRIQEILEGMIVFPKVLNLQKQAEFSLGYYHERQDLYKKKEEEGAKQNEL